MDRQSMLPFSKVHVVLLRIAAVAMVCLTWWIGKAFGAFFGSFNFVILVAVVTHLVLAVQVWRGRLLEEPLMVELIIAGVFAYMAVMTGYVVWSAPGVVSWSFWEEIPREVLFAVAANSVAAGLMLYVWLVRRWRARAGMFREES